MSYEEIVDMLKKILTESLDEIDLDSEIELDDNLIALGLNSLTFINTVVKCETEFDIEFDDDELALEEEFNTLRKLADCIKIKMEAGE